MMNWAEGIWWTVMAPQSEGSAEFLLASMAVIEGVSGPLLLEDLMVHWENGSWAEHW